MIQGYAIYLRTHRETGKQYGGCVWGTKPNWTAEKACARRWRIEDKLGICGIFGGFESKIILFENRSNAPDMSDGLYRIRILADESAVVADIPSHLRLNKVSPLMQITNGMLRESILGLGGRRTHELHPGQAEEMGRKQGRIHAENKTGVCGRSLEKMRADWLLQPREVRVQNGRRNATSGRLASYRTSEHQSAAGKNGGTKSAPVRRAAGTGIFDSKVRLKGAKASGMQAKEKQTGIFAPGFDRSQGGRTVVEKRLGIFGRTPEQHRQDSQKAGRASALKRFLKTVAWG